MDLLEVIKKAEKNKAAVGHFNISSLEMFKAVAEAARNLGLPIVIGLSEGEREYIGPQRARDLVDSYNKEYTQGEHFIFLNADHTYSLEKVKEASELGYDSIVFDGSKLSFEENIKQTRRAVEIAKKIKPGIIVEGELGYIGSGSQILKELPEGAAVKLEDLTKPDEAARFVKETGVDSFAPAVGNIHGMFQNIPNPKLAIERIGEIRKAAGVPLTLHGGSGISDEDFVNAVQAGISLIHISTELRVAWRKGLEESLQDNPEEVAPYKLAPAMLEKIEKIVAARLRLFSKS